MRGKVTCIFMGGPDGRRTLTLDARACQDLVALEGKAWFRKGKNGRIEVIEGNRVGDPCWISYSISIYQKQVRSPGEDIKYKFLRKDIVNRCDKILESKGRRCKNAALPAHRYCEIHAKLNHVD